MNALLFGPMRIEFRDFFIAGRSESRMAIRDCCLALLFAIGNHLNFDFANGEAGNEEDVFQPARLFVVSGDQPEPFPAI